LTGEDDQGGQKTRKGGNSKRTFLEKLLDGEVEKKPVDGRRVLRRRDCKLGLEVIVFQEKGGKPPLTVPKSKTRTKSRKPGDPRS